MMQEKKSLATRGPWAKFNVLATVVNKVLLEQQCSFTLVLRRAAFPLRWAELSSCNTAHVTTELTLRTS